MGEPFSRMSISLPADLKVRMEACNEPVNWSALAARAFADKMDEIDARKKGATMDDVVKRLKASKERTREREYAGGKEAGRKWAMEKAEAKDLELLADQIAERGLDAVARDPRGPDCDVMAWRFACDDAEFVFFGHPEWIGGPDFPRGFVAGAIELWEAVKDKVLEGGGEKAPPPQRILKGARRP